MSTNYKVKVNNSIEFEIDSQQLSQLDAIQTSSSKFHVLKDSKSYDAEIVSTQSNPKNYTVKVNNNMYSVDVFDALDTLIQSLGFEVGASKKINNIKAPMPGLILDITIGIGQEVKENDSLLILEAMKMENVLTSPRDGIIKSLSVKKGDTVEKNQLLVEFE